MTYILREITIEDKEYFNKLITSKDEIYYGKNILENVQKNVKMSFIGGQGYMHEDGTEYSEMAHYALVIWERNIFTVEFFSCKKFTDRTPKKLKYKNIYKIKAIKSSCSYDKQKILNIVKQCFIAYGNGGKSSSVCEKVSFIDEEVRWL